MKHACPSLHSEYGPICINANGFALRVHSASFVMIKFWKCKNFWGNRQTFKQHIHVVTFDQHACWGSKAIGSSLCSRILFLNGQTWRKDAFSRYKKQASNLITFAFQKSWFTVETNRNFILCSKILGRNSKRDETRKTKQNIAEWY